MRLDALLSYLRDTNYDVYLFSEITSGLPNLHHEACSHLLEEVSSVLPHRVVYAPMWQITSDRGVFSQGVAIASKYPMSSFWGQYLYKNVRPMSADFKATEHPGVLLTATISWKDQPLRLAVTHFPWSMYPEITQEQTDAAALMIPALTDPEEPVVFGGDLNLTAESSIYQELASKLRADRNPHIVSTLHPTIHPASHRQLAVDSLFSSHSLECLETWVDNSDGSDHLPLVGKYR